MTTDGCDLGSDGCGPCCGEADDLDRARSVWTGREAIRTWIAGTILAGGLGISLLGPARQLVVGPVSLGAGEGLLLVATAVGAASIVRTGLAAVRRAKFNIDILETIAILAAVALGMFVEAALLAVLISVAHLLETYAMARTRESIRDLVDLSPETARVHRDGRPTDVPVEDVTVGETVLVKPGERIPLDGTVLEGASAVTESPITGESVPVDKGEGEEVYAGTIAEDGYLEIEVTAAAEDTTLARIIDLVRETRANRTEFERYVDRLAAYYTPAIGALALLVATVPPLALGGAWHPWLVRGLTLVVIACPCAFVISTPVSVFSAITSAAKEGVLVKGGRHLEALGTVDVAAFDKTGTITTGELTVSDVVPATGIDESELLCVVRGIEARSDHPIADAIVRYADDRSVEGAPVTEFESLAGRGVRATVDGDRYRVGRPELFDRVAVDGRARSDGGIHTTEVSAHTADDDASGSPVELSNGTPPDDTTAGLDGTRISELRDEGKTVVLVGRNGRLCGAIGLADEPRPDAARAVERLQERGVETVMLTGDSDVVARAVADDVGIDQVRSGLLPEEKVDAVADLETEGAVAMVGDGVNDAPALATATVGVAMGAAGTDTAIETADVALLADDLNRLPYAFDLARSGRSVIKQNVWGSLLVEAVLSIAAPLGLVGPVLAVLLGDAGLTLGVTGNALRLARIPGEN